MSLFCCPVPLCYRTSFICSLTWWRHRPTHDVRNKSIPGAGHYRILSRTHNKCIACSLQFEELTNMTGLATLIVFYVNLFENKTEHHLLSKCVVLKLLRFPHCIREARFSTYAATKSKYRYRLNQWRTEGGLGCSNPPPPKFRRYRWSKKNRRLDFLL